MERRHRLPTASMALLLGVGIFAAAAPAAASGLIGPSEYLCFDTAATAASGDCAGKDSPWKAVVFDFFHLDDVEGGTFASPLVAPGVTATAGCAGRVVPSGNCPFRADEVFRLALTDSVDEDDGAIDGLGRTTAAGGHALWADAAAGILFTFDAGVLGRLPTHAGVVWTDGRDPVVFEAFDAAGASLGTLTGFHADGTFEGTTADDRFYGAVDPGGLSAIRISSGRGGIEVDHLQFGALPLDSDGDGVADGDDVCPGTALPEAGVPSVRLGVNRFALVDGDGVFDTVEPTGRGPRRGFTTADTGGCSCEQIILRAGLGQGHRKHGCSLSAMDDWVASLGG